MKKVLRKAMLHMSKFKAVYLKSKKNENRVSYKRGWDF